MLWDNRCQSDVDNRRALIGNELGDELGDDGAMEDNGLAERYQPGLVVGLATHA
jgi:hypothetical protein